MGVRQKQVGRVQDRLGILDVRPLPVPGQLEEWGGVVLPPGNRWRLVVEAQGRVNLGLLSPEEQDQVEDAWQAVLRAVDFPLQICVQSRPVELPPLVVEGGQGGLGAYAEAYRAHLALWSQHAVQVRRVFFVVPADGDATDAARLLERRVRQLAIGLERWVRLRVLGVNEVLQVLATFWRRDRAPADSPDAWDWGRLAVEGVRLQDVRAAAATRESSGQ